MNLDSVELCGEQGYLLLSKFHESSIGKCLMRYFLAWKYTLKVLTITDSVPSSRSFLPLSQVG